MRGWLQIYWFCSIKCICTKKWKREILVFWGYHFVIQKLYYHNGQIRLRTEEWFCQSICYFWILFDFQISLYWFWNDWNCNNNLMFLLPRISFLQEGFFIFINSSTCCYSNSKVSPGMKFERIFRFMVKPHTSNIRMTYKYIRVIYGWHASTYERHTDDIQEHPSDIRMT